MKSMMKRTTIREIKGSFGRYVAILAIIALGVGFFSGIKITKEAMVKTISDFYDEKNFYDLHLLSTLGYTEENVEAFGSEEDVSYAEGSYIFDVIYEGIGDSEEVLKTFSMPENVNGIELSEGRLPENENECVVDAKMSDIEIGDTISMTDDNSEDTLDSFANKEFTVVGKVYSSYYINYERGTTTLGNGKINGFIYVDESAFDCDYFTDVFICFSGDYELYSDEYEDFIDEKTDEWDDICYEQVTLRYHDLLTDAGLPSEMADEMSIDDEASVTYYILDRNTNIGYVCFESDSDIVDGVAKVFPVFFILVAALVCMTTMNRMVEEQRTQIGVLKALGYSRSSIMGKYLFYSGSAAVTGCILGYFLFTYVFPKVIWYAYQMMYIGIDLEYVFNWQLAVISLVVSLLCSIGTTWLSCRHELGETAANLMRPKSPKAGKRIFLERITFVWKRMKFLHKVSARNIFRYKKRFFMMILGIGGCSALVLTGFGMKDSIADFAEQQYSEIEIYDASVVMSCEPDTAELEELTEIFDEKLDEYTFAATSSWELVTDDSVKSINMVILSEPENADDFIDFHTSDGVRISYPETGEAVINNYIADLYDISVGDTVTVRDSDMNEITATVSAIYKNYVYNYIYISSETYEEQMGEAPEFKTIYININDELDGHEVSAEILAEDIVSSVTLNSDTEERLANMMQSLDYIVLMVIICAAALAFIVLYNLTNINITERIREIATIKVLGFFKNETSAYVFRENRILTAIGIAFGIVVGIFLHRFVMTQIKVDMVCFDTYIAPISYVYSIVLTFVFNFLVNRVMSVKLEKINMAESLKSVD